MAATIMSLTVCGWASDPVMTGGLALEGPTPGACVLMQSPSSGTLQGQVINVFRKTGSIDDSGVYAFRGQMRAQVDPRTIEALLRRCTRLTNDDPDMRMQEIDDAVNKLFQDMGTSGADLSTGEKLSVLIAMSESDLSLRDNLLFYAKRFPSVGVVAGTAFMEPVDETVTYELRLCPEGSYGIDDGRQVVGRVSVDPSIHYVAAAPGQPQAVRLMDQRGSLNVRLRWAAADNQNKAGPLVFGYNLYRIPYSVASPGWINNPPSRSELEAALGLDEGTLDQSQYIVNTLPILSPEELSEDEADTTELDELLGKRYAYPQYWDTFQFSDAENLTQEVDAVPASRPRRIELEDQIHELQSVFCYIDDNNRWFGGEPFVKGTRYFYTVAARNALGIGGELSPFCLIRIPDYTPVPAPENLRVENAFAYNDTTKTHSQKMVLRWDALRDENGDVRKDVRYYVYRWNAPTEMLDYVECPFEANIETLIEDESGYFNGQAPVPAGLIAGPDNLADPDQDGVVSMADQTISPDYEDITFYYTVRAAVSDGSGDPGVPVFSPHSAPAWGVLRDREGPAPATDLAILISCTSVAVNFENYAIREIEVDDGLNLPMDSHLLRLTCLPDLDPDLASVLRMAFFQVKESGNVIATKSANFVDGQAACVDIQIEPTASSLEIHCCAIVANGNTSEWMTHQIDLGKPTTPSLLEVDFLADVTVQVGDAGSKCHAYYPYDPDGEFVPPTVSFYPGEGTWSWDITRRVDDGEEEFVAADEQPDDGEPMDTSTPVVFVDGYIPATASRICYYLQTYDQNGNPSASQLVGCLPVSQGRLELPVPSIAESRSSGSAEAPRLNISWFCPPSGVERFAILVTDAETGEAVSDFRGGAISAPIEVPNVETIDGMDYARYATVRKDAFVEGGLLSASTPAVVDAGLFSAVITHGIEIGHSYLIRVQALGPSVEGAIGPENVTSTASEPCPFVWRELSETVIGEQGPDVNWPTRALAEARKSGASGLRPVFIDTMDNESWEQFAGVGVPIGKLQVTTAITFEKGLQSDDPSTGPAYKISESVELGNVFFDMSLQLLPCVLYRMEVDPDSADESNYYNYQPISGDLIQCSPVITTDNIAYDPVNKNGDPRVFRDPFLFLGTAVQGSNSYYYTVYVTDNQPVIRGSTYRYFLVSLSDRGEIKTIWNAGTLSIPE